MGLVLFGGFLVTLGPIIGLIKTAPFEKDACPSVDDPLGFGLAACRACFDRAVFHGLEFLETVPAGAALIFVGWHESSFFF